MTPFGMARIVHDGQPVLGVVRDDTVRPLSDLLGERGPVNFEQALENWEPLVDSVAAALASVAVGPATPSAAVEFLPPAVDRPTVWCAGANYTDHVIEMGVTDFDKRAFHFLSPATVLSGHRAVVARPTGATKLDWEIELAAVIGRPARRVSTEDALSHVAGYTIANDVSVRDEDWLRHPFFGIDWTASKNSDGCTPLGPSVVPARFVPEPGALGLTLAVNGHIRQDSSTSLMIVDLAEQIAALSQLVTLQPGDLVLTGTPAGTAAAHEGAYLVDGDVMTATITGLGTLENTVV
ncbi:fumarylacetoacetate hydrolase family protein [Streptomyces griseiscabiei]|uniref:Fumarylacetoacetate hydrolase family protein n=1 Tax=Streptomyces griseiscabiei TaxID=2993540 RepID=A0ABU4LGY2_9ACTN|nr:fumarylacetoacetate hydrolase family protein [Streptomyces griseiscabiei]MBZ3900382.1 fumarylacetoacetate hydrolase family protein [Streptomyces griseiscabiei]MDX2914550.1 fumarylacetoacetate hydrolase family protein [Streptomyces griseiscabiei]